MRYLNSSTIKSLRDYSPQEREVLKRAYRVLLLAYHGRIFLPHNDIRPIGSSTELIDAHQLVYREYLRKGLCTRNSAGMYFTPHTLLPTTVTLCSHYRKTMIGTCSIVEDGQFGLPSDSLYKGVLDKFRASKHQLVEISALALDHKVFRRKSRSISSVRKFSIAMNLFSGVLRYLVRHTQATHVVILISEKHRKLYEIIGFQQFAESRNYELVNCNAVPMIISIQEFLNAYTEHLPALFMVKSFKRLLPRQGYKPNTQDLAMRAELNPSWFLKISQEAAEHLVSQFPKFRSILDFIRTHSEDFLKDLEERTHEVWQRYRKTVRTVFNSSSV